MLPTVGDLLSLDVLRRGSPKVVAGAGGLSARVRWVHVLELADAAHLLQGGAVLLPESRTLATGLPYRMLLDGAAPRMTREPGITAGYHDLLVVALAASPAGADPERAFQVLNVILLILQAACVYLFFRWAQSGVELAATTLYVLVPFVFGINRCVLSENHVFLAMLALPLASVLVISSRQRSWPTEALKGSAAGLVFGILSSTREYVAPTVVAFALVTPLALFLSRRFVAGAAVLVTSLPFACATGIALVRVLPTIVAKVGQGAYYVPLSELLPHIVLRVLGPAQTALLLAGAVLAGFALGRNRKDVPHRPLWLVLATLLGLALLFAAAVLGASNRSGRLALPVAFSLLAAIPIAMRLRNWKPSPRVSGALLAGVGSAALLLSFDLFIAYDGGVSFAARPFGLDYWSHPLHLRPLRGPGDMHVIDQ